MKKIPLFLVILLFHIPFVRAQAEISEIARLGRGSASSLSWRPDGEILAVGGSAGVWFFDPDYQQLAHYPDFPAWKIEFSPDGNYLAVSNFDDITEFWRLGSEGELLARSEALSLYGYNLRWSPDSKNISTFYARRKDREFQGMQLNIWDAAGQLRWSIPVSDSVVDVVWSPDSQYLAAIDEDGSIVVMDSATGETTQIIQLPQEMYSPTGIAFQDDGEGFWLIFEGSQKLWSWNLRENRLIETPSEMQFVFGGLWRLEKQPDGQFLTTRDFGGGGAPGGIYILGEEIVPIFIMYDDYIVDYAWMPGTNRLTLLTGNGMIRDRNVLSDDSTEYQLFASQNVIAWSPDSRWIVQTTGTNPSNFSYPVMLWDVTQAGLESYQPDQVMYPYLSAKWSRWLPDSQHVMVFSDNTVPHALCLIYGLEKWAIFDDAVTYEWEGGLCGLQNMPDTSDLNWDYVGDWTEDFSRAASAYRNEISIFKEIPDNDLITKFEAEARVISVDWSPHANYLLAVSERQDTGEIFVEVWELSTRKRMFLLPLTEPLIWAEWSPDERSLEIVTGSEADYTLSIVDVPTGSKRFDISFIGLPTIRWKPDGTQLAIMQTPIEGEKIDIVDSQTGEAFPLVTMSDVITITGMDWHPSGNFLAISTGSELRIYEDRSVVTSVSSESRVIAWSPDGTMLATRYPDETIGIWRF